MPGSLDDLSFTVFPPAIDISTPANQQIFNPQFGVANTSATETVSIKRALLLVPVTTNVINLAANTDMTPGAITPDWTFSAASAPPSDKGYAAFALLPDDSKGAIAPGGSVTFNLTGVTVNTTAGTAVLRLEAHTSAGLWTPTCEIELTTPSTTPTITRYSITPADPQTLTTLQGQSVVLNWTTTGAADCKIEDDQGHKWDDQPTSGAISDTPLQGNAPVQSTPQLGRYYNRTYKLYAFSGDGAENDEDSNFVSVQLPTISSFSVTPASLAPDQQATVTWSVANIDPNLGTITLTIDPADGTGPYTIAIPPSQTSGSGVVTPTPQTTTTYTLSVDNGYGATLSSPQQQVTSSLQPGWQKMDGLNLDVRLLTPFGLVAFADYLWCWSQSGSQSWLYRTSDGTHWTAVKPNQSLPQLDGLIVADLGDGEKLWAFGGGNPYLASSSDGVNWVTLPMPPYPRRYYANYVAGDGTILVLGGNMGNTDVWSTSDGNTWTQVGKDFPPRLQFSAVARFAGKLQAVVGGAGRIFSSYSSSDGGASWSGTKMPFQMQGVCPSLLPLADMLLLLGARGAEPPPLMMDPTGVWFASGYGAELNTDDFWSGTTYLGCVWFGKTSPMFGPLRFFRLNKLPPRTTLTLTPTGNSSSE